MQNVQSALDHLQSDLDVGLILLVWVVVGHLGDGLGDNLNKEQKMLSNLTLRFGISISF